MRDGLESGIRSSEGASNRAFDRRIHGVGYPALDLVLTNSRDHTLARRIFQPRDYLEPSRDATAGIPAKGEMTINLDLDTTDLSPAWFRLDLMAASPP